jgi:hypothetical protein
LAIAPTAAAVAGRVAPGGPVKLVWVSIPLENGTGVSAFFGTHMDVESWSVTATSKTCPRLPVSLQRELYWRLRDGGVGDANARFEYRPVPSMPPPVLTPMDVENPPLNWPR